VSRPVRLFLALLGAGLLAAACSSSPNKSNTSTTTSTTTAPATTTSTTTAPATTTTTAAASGCGAVTATAGITEGAAGTITGSITLTEVGTASCTLIGYPVMAMFAGSGASLPVTMVNGLSVSISSAANGQPTSVTLGPTSKLAFTYQFSDVPSGSQTSCPSSATADVTLPSNGGTTAKFPIVMDPCSNGTIRVSPLYPSS
jgi:hypothetical protein